MAFKKTICEKCNTFDRYSDGRCKICHKLRTEQYKKEDPERFKSVHRKHFLANKEKIYAKLSIYRKQNPEKEKVRSAKYRNENSEKCKAAIAKYLNANPEKRKKSARDYVKRHPVENCISSSHRRAAKVQATPKWANEFFISEAYSLAALRTKMFGFKWHVDHIVPIRSPLVCGLHVENNLQVIPGTVNQSKGNRYWPEMP